MDPFRRGSTLEKGVLGFAAHRCERRQDGKTTACARMCATQRWSSPSLTRSAGLRKLPGRTRFKKCISSHMGPIPSDKQVAPEEDNNYYHKYCDYLCY